MHFMKELRDLPQSDSRFGLAFRLLSKSASPRWRVSLICMPPNGTLLVGSVCALRPYRRLCTSTTFQQISLHDPVPKLALSCFKKKKKLHSQLLSCLSEPSTHQVFDPPITERVAWEPSSLPPERFAPSRKFLRCLRLPCPARCTKVSNVSYSILRGENNGHPIQMAASLIFVSWLLTLVHRLLLLVSAFHRSSTRLSSPTCKLASSSGAHTRFWHAPCDGTSD